MFSDKIDPIFSTKVETVDIKDLIPKLIFKVSWSWTGD